MSEYPNRVGAVCAYPFFLRDPICMTVRDRMFLQEMFEREFPDYDIAKVPRLDFDASHWHEYSEQFDGILLMPTMENEYWVWWGKVINACHRYLEARGWIVRIDSLPNWPMRNRVISASDLACLPPARQQGMDFVYVRFQLGKLFAGCTPDRVVNHCRAPQIGTDKPLRLLDTAAGLVALSLLERKNLLKKIPMRMDCPGTLFSVDGDGKWGDSMRWDVQPPTEYTPGVIQLDWNWSKNRPRATHGTATGIVYP